jgi:hypothetical protein
MCDPRISVREIFSCGRARPQERSERHARIAFGGQLVPAHRPHAIAYLAAERRGRKPTTRKKIRTLDEERGENERHDTHQLHEDVERRAGGVLEGITDGVTDDRGVVGLTALRVD